MADILVQDILAQDILAQDIRSVTFVQLRLRGAFLEAMQSLKESEDSISKAQTSGVVRGYTLACLA